MTDRENMMEILDRLHVHGVNGSNRLHEKYYVYKAPTGERVENCFVLRPDKDEAAIAALRAYAAATENKELAEDIFRWVGKGLQEPLTVEEVRAMPEIVWMEWRIGDEVEPMIPSKIETNTVTGTEYFPLTDGLYAAMSTYGRYWRFWAEKPTEEERQAAEWGN